MAKDRKISRYQKNLIGKLERQIEFKENQHDSIAVDLLKEKLEEVHIRIADKEEKRQNLLHLSDPHKFAKIHKVSDIDKCIEQIFFENKAVQKNHKALIFAVWAKQNHDLREYFTSYTEVAEAVIGGWYVSIEEILESKERVFISNPEYKLEKED
jgi:hypothetical protein